MNSFLEILYEALHSSGDGLVVRTSNPERAKQRLYQARSKAADPALGVLQFRTSPHNPAGEIWIVKGTPNGNKT